MFRMPPSRSSRRRRHGDVQQPEAAPGGTRHHLTASGEMSGGQRGAFSRNGEQMAPVGRELDKVAVRSARPDWPMRLPARSNHNPLGGLSALVPRPIDGSAVLRCREPAVAADAPTCRAMRIGSPVDACVAINGLREQRPVEGKQDEAAVPLSNVDGTRAVRAAVRRSAHRRHVQRSRNIPLCSRPTRRAVVQEAAPVRRIRVRS